MTTSSSRQLPKRVQNTETKNVSENGNSPAIENGSVTDVKETEKSDDVEEDNVNNTISDSQEKQSEE